MRLAFISPRIGADVVGGAEYECLEVARHLIGYGVDVELLSTTVADYHRYEDAFPEGDSTLGGVTLRRFSPDRKNPKHFLELSAKLHHQGPLSPQEESSWIEAGLNSSKLLKFLEVNYETYDLFIFFQYLRTLTIEGVRRFPEKAVVFPLLHDEPFARLSIVGETLNRAAGLIFNSEAEKDLAIKLYELDGVPKTVTGLGLDEVRTKPGVFRLCSDPYILYTGRIEWAKNLPLLFDFFLHYKEKDPGPLKLVLCGSGDYPIPESKWIIPAGYLSREELSAAYANAIAIVQPSEVESFSLSIFESWQRGRPVLVSAKCEVTRRFCEESHGGLYFRNYSEFERCLEILDRDPDLANALGRQGQEFVRGEYNWEKISGRYIDFFKSFDFYRKAAATSLVSINFNLVTNDAVGNNLVNKSRVLSDAGSSLQIYVETALIPPADLERLAKVVTSQELRNGHSERFWDHDIYFFDYAVHYDLLKILPTLQKKAKHILFDYHGITPPHLWGDSENLKMLEEGVKNVSLLRAGKRVIAHSNYMRGELVEYGIAGDRVDVIPYSVPLHDFFPTEKDWFLMQSYGIQEDDFVLLYVGRMAGNKRVDLLAEALAMASQTYPKLKLMLVGDYGVTAYRRQLVQVQDILKKHHLENALILTGIVPHEELYKYFNLCDLYVTSSLHEGFCIPIIEAMACGKPVIASNCTAMPETVGDAGLLMEPGNAEHLAELILRLASDQALYDELAEKGQNRARLFGPDVYRQNMLSFLRRVLAE